jgi:hypothetical protein
MTDVTQLLSALDQGNPHAASRLLPLVLTSGAGGRRALVARERFVGGFSWKILTSKAAGVALAFNDFGTVRLVGSRLPVPASIHRTM